VLSNRSQGWLADGVRFAFAGGANTALTLVVYQIAVGFTGPSLAYILSWAVGLAFVYYVYPERVFSGGRRDTMSRLALVANYVVAFGLGLIAVNAVSHYFGADRIAIIAALALTTTYTFFSSRALLRRKS
jgi:putative flippase GtrA